MEEEYKESEKRKTPRIIKSIPVRYMFPLEFSGGKWETFTYDIGGGGLRIKRKEPIKENTIAALEIDLPTKEGEVDKVKTLAQVVWCRKVGEEEDYSVGLKFVFFDYLTQKKISHYVEKKISRYVEEELERLNEEINPGG